MRIVAFVGPSGTGKSYRALWVAKQKGINYIIDDGILINENKVIAGTSAKKEPTKIAATKRACFFEKEHILDVTNAINEYKPKEILILATSDNMAQTIAKALEIGEIEETIYIKDIATQEEINKAIESRKVDGKHVIPVPTFELRKTFGGYFMDAIKVMKKDKHNSISEKTVIRPTYSYLGKYIISDAVIKDIVRHVISQEPDIAKISSIDISTYDGSVSATVNVIVDYNKLNKNLFPKVQSDIKNEIEKLTAMNVLEINLVLKSINVDKK